MCIGIGHDNINEFVKVRPCIALRRELAEKYGSATEPEFRMNRLASGSWNFKGRLEAERLLQPSDRSAQIPIPVFRDERDLSVFSAHLIRAE
jgi:hypothetical protein